MHWFSYPTKMWCGDETSSDFWTITRHIPNLIYSSSKHIRIVSNPVRSSCSTKDAPFSPHHPLKCLYRYTKCEKSFSEHAATIDRRNPQISFGDSARIFIGFKRMSVVHIKCLPPVLLPFISVFYIRASLRPINQQFWQPLDVTHVTNFNQIFSN